jgi:hypothetical protein
MKKDIPVQSKNTASQGKVKSNKLRRPQRSMVKRAGMAKTQLRMPVPMEARRAEVVEYPDSIKMVVE